MLGKSGGGVFRRESYFTATIFTRRFVVMASAYIKAMHPKTQILPELHAVERILKAGWVGQLKIHGHRAQIHIPADPDEKLIAYNRQGRPHAKPLPAAMCKELRRVFRPADGWTVLDAEWMKSDDKLYVFDVLKLDGESLRKLNYLERYRKLPRAFISPHISVLPILRDVSSCMRALQSKARHIEGLVFKSSKSCGFSDSSIVRCRKRA